MAEPFSSMMHFKEQGLRTDMGDVGSLVWVCFHSFLQYSIPGSAPRVCLLWGAEWEIAGASLLPLIRAFCSFSSVKSQSLSSGEKEGRKKKRRNPLWCCNLKLPSWLQRHGTYSLPLVGVEAAKKTKKPKMRIT